MDFEMRGELGMEQLKGLLMEEIEQLSAVPF